jgi:hypothetical protein
MTRKCDSGVLMIRLYKVEGASYATPNSKVDGLVSVRIRDLRRVEEEPILTN